jgi:hypothetical protein
MGNVTRGRASRRPGRASARIRRLSWSVHGAILGTCVRPGEVEALVRWGPNRAVREFTVDVADPHGHASIGCKL